MVEYEIDAFVAVSVVGLDAFKVSIDGEWVNFTRDGLTELRAIIDQALNTSTEELEASS